MVDRNRLGRSNNRFNSSGNILDGKSIETIPIGTRFSDALFAGRHVRAKQHPSPQGLPARRSCCARAAWPGSSCCSPTNPAPPRSPPRRAARWTGWVRRFTSPLPAVPRVACIGGCPDPWFRGTECVLELGQGKRWGRTGTPLARRHVAPFRRQR